VFQQGTVFAGVGAIPALGETVRALQLPQWRSRRELERHFHTHRRLLRVRTVAQYDQSARETMDVGTHFEYRDRETGEWRVGYYDRPTERFVALTEDEEEIVSHFRCDEEYVIGLPRSTYA
jgi:hypothetical protein